MQSSGLEYTAIYQVLDDLANAELVPVGALGKVFTALDQLRASRAPSEHIKIAEQISIAMHQWELARRKRDDEAEKSAREKLAALTDEWMEMRLPEAHMAVPLGEAAQSLVAPIG